MTKEIVTEQDVYALLNKAFEEMTITYKVSGKPQSEIKITMDELKEIFK